MVEELCSKGALMDRGTIVAVGVAPDLLVDRRLLDKHSL
jgi:hypothetical protein